MGADTDFAIQKDDAIMLGELLALDMPQAAAKWLLSLKFPEAWSQEAEALAGKNSAGEITDAELRRLDTYMHVGDLLTILQLEAEKAATHANGVK